MSTKTEQGAKALNAFNKERYSDDVFVRKQLSFGLVGRPLGEE